MIRNKLSACLAMILFASAGIAALAPRTAQSAQAETGAESVADIIPRPILSIFVNG